MPIAVGSSSGSSGGSGTGGRRPPQQANYTNPHAARTQATSTSSSSSASLRVAVQKSLMPFTASSATPAPALQRPSFTVPLRRTPATQHNTNSSSSSSPPTPSSLSTSGSDGGDGDRGGGGGQSAVAAAAVVLPASSAGKAADAGTRPPRAARKANPVSSVSIQAAAASASAAAEVGYVMGDNNSHPYHANTAVMASSKAAAAAAAVTNSNVSGAFATPPTAFPPPAPSSTLSPALPPEDEVAAYAKEVQRQQILAHANDLLTFCAIGNKVTSIRQCTSSFFVLLYQRLFDCSIAGIDRSPNTAEKRRRNVTLVLEQLRQHPYSLEGIAAEEVVKLNEDHISRLIMVFVQVAEDMRRQQQLQQHQSGLSVGAPYLATAGAAAPVNADTMTSAQAANQATQGVPALIPSNDGAGAGEDCGLARNSSGAYVPMGYTVAEVMPSHAALQQQPSPPQQYPAMGDRAAGYPFANPVLVALAANQHHRHSLNDFYVGRAPPLNGGLFDPSGGGTQASPQQHVNPNITDAAAAAAAGMMNPHDGEESPSSVSYYLDSSAIPTDELVAEWYRDLVYPALNTPKSEEGNAVLHSVVTTPSSEVRYAKGDPVHRGRPTRSDPAAPSITTTATTSSSSPLHAGPREVQKGGAVGDATANRKPAAQQPAAAAAAAAKGNKASPTPAGRARRPTTDAQYVQHHAHDIVRRCQRLGEALDAQEGCHRQAFVAQPLSPPKAAATAAAEKERYGSRLHRNPPEKDTAKDRQEDGGVHAGEEAGPLPTGAAVTAEGQTASAQTATPTQHPPPLPYTRANISPQQQQQHSPPRQLARHHRLAVEPPLTRQERDFFMHRPQQHSEAVQRDRKIERLRAARYLGDMQQLLRRRMRHEYDVQMNAMRGSLKASMKTAKAEKTDLLRRVRDENERYRAAYATLMEAAANEAQVPARVMSRHTAQLADYYATSLQRSNALCEALKREADHRTRAELLQYAEEVSAWQQHFLL
ncbi:hypothetical protein ABB37_06468 [Leptomonas pyrrhocoris]|uniref:Uncharacterized protein n=1 Tax=Leptomonas pyrrhocoris TaxID=157538 RepID=A0A0M9FY57_LEPPY|nr:hypothetical protein ABB37_06468 [Leptomonas pyrrhocoris]KPA78337.1 hypothetical protein ABB37_06468 [Leptomonas pyrrhocoris]|eukprot:XP_015656776.1 hypothetical protein ABB37_06468 [Leptomonas pyrrhocoris]